MEFSFEFAIGTLFGFLSISSMFCKIYTYLLKLCWSRNSRVNDCEEQMKEDLEDDTDETFLDAENEDDFSSIDINAEQRFNTTEELHKAEEEQQASEKLQSLRCQECRQCRHTSLIQPNQDTGMSKLLEAVQKLQETADSQQQLLEIGKKIYEHLNHDILNALNALTKKMESIERNTEQLKIQHGTQKTRTSNLERESMKNSANLIGLNYSFRTLLSMRPNFVVEAAENGYDRNASSTYAPQQPATSTNLAFMNTAGSSPQAAHTVSIPPPPPPPPPGTSVARPPPPPPPPPMMMGTMTASRNTVQATATCSSSPATATAETAPKTYGRIEITADLLKSVVLKPAGQRKTGNRILPK